MVSSELLTLEEIMCKDRDYSFEIPIYQRLYVWKEEQVKILLDDLYDAFESQKSIFYLGNVLVVQNAESETHFDLIDGQQRFTTLWMYSMVFKEKLEPFIWHDDSFRIHFSIRDHVAHYFENYINNKERLEITDTISNALGVIESFHHEKKRITEFTEFILKKVKLLFTIVPKETDLNKLFEIINNRGVQLQHHEILKAKLLKYIPSNERLKYSYLWDASSYMNNYVEKNLRGIAKIKISEAFDNKKSKADEEDLAYANEVLSSIGTAQSNKFTALELETILRNNNEVAEPKEDNLKEYQSDNNVRSIITFSMLLQHTLRIYLIEDGKKEHKDIQKILDKELLSIFDTYFFCDSDNEKNVKYFIEILWEVRYMFDKYIIKWVETDEGETHIINQLYLNHNKKKKSKSLIRREPETNEGVALLQSMLYHSQQLTTHYWLTPYLYYLYVNGGNNNKHYDFLRHLDNNLLSNRSDETLMQRTNKFVNDFHYTIEEDYSELYEPLGVSFSHYWFYKLEFILWYLLKDNKDNRWKEFRFTAKNSVEHISPQHPKEEDGNKVETTLDIFGNTALVSRSINSEYSNNSFSVKRAKFLEKNSNRIDSLKMEMIYQNKSWNDDKAKAHQDEMFGYLEQYFSEGIDYE